MLAGDHGLLPGAPDCGPRVATASAMYEEFRIRIETREGGDFEVTASGPAGEIEGTFTVPFDERDLRILILEMGVPRGVVRGIDTPTGIAARELGTKLFEALFADEVGNLFMRSRTLAEAHGDRLRVTLALTQAPKLMHLPWEYLYDSDAGRFLAVSVRTPVVRYLDIPSQRRPMVVAPPLRILAMVSNPTDVEQLDSSLERAHLEEAIAGLQREGLVEVTWLENASLDALQEELRHREHHIFHYIGHGGFDPAEDASVLLLEGSDGRACYVTGEQLGTVLFDHTSLSLAVLNACEAARASMRDPFAGVASSLVRQEVPAVIAMQFPITDKAAIRFSREFYRALADGLPVDAATAEARKAMYASDPENVEWGTPVLFMRVADGRIFELERTTIPARPPKPTADEQIAEPPPPEPPDEGGPVTHEPRPRGRRRWVVALLGLLALVAIGIVAAVVLTRGSDEGAAPTTGDGGNSGSEGAGVLAGSAVPLGGAEGATLGGLSPSWARQDVVYVQGEDQVERPIHALDADARAAAGRSLVQDGTNDYPSRSIRGEIVFQHIDRGRGWGIYIVPRGESEAIAIVDDDQDQVTPSWSPDGREIVYSSLADSFTFDLQVVERASGELTSLELPGQDEWDEFFPLWSPDGNELAVVRVSTSVSQCPRGDLWLADYDPVLRTGSNLRPIVRDFGDVRHPSFAPDGRIVFSANPEGAFRLFVVDPDDEQPEPVEIQIDGLAAKDAVDPSWSHDDPLRIAFGAGSFQPCAPEKWAPWPSWSPRREIRVLTLATD